MRLGSLIIISAMTCAALAGSFGCSSDLEGEENGGVYCCRYRSESTHCNSGTHDAPEEQSFEFNLDDYVEGSTPESVCGNFSGSHTQCGGGCCINIYYTNLGVTPGSC